MREIKFNFYNTRTNKYTTWNDSNAGMSMSAFITHEHLKFLQYTGLKDKNGVEIYEGDILEIENHPFDRNEKTPRWNGRYVVEYEPVNMELIISHFLGAHSGWMLFRMRHYATVIGNVFDQPELLEVAK